MAARCGKGRWRLARWRRPGFSSLQRVDSDTPDAPGPSDPHTCNDQSDDQHIRIIVQTGSLNFWYSHQLPSSLGLTMQLRGEVDDRLSSMTFSVNRVSCVQVQISWCLGVSAVSVVSCLDYYNLKLSWFLFKSKSCAWYFYTSTWTIKSVIELIEEYIRHKCLLCELFCLF